MRLLIVADTAHTWPTNAEGRYDLAPLVRAHAPDALVSLGDFDDLHAEVMARSGAPAVYGVYGNHCVSDYMAGNGIVDLIGDRSVPAGFGTLELPGHQPVSVLSVQGCVRYKPGAGDVLFTQEQYAAVLDRLPAADLVITHAPPLGVNDAPDDAHVGVEALRRWVDRHQPRWLIHGHTYENPPRSRHGRTEIIYVHGHAVVDLPI